MKFKASHLLLFVSISGTFVGLFQNCSKAQFTSEPAELASVVDPLDTSVTPGPSSPNTRLKVITPEISNIQSNQKVKALFVVDNSATMAYSQKNLADHISVLLNKLSQYDTEIQIVSSSYTIDDGTGTSALYRQTSETKSVQVNGYLGTGVTTALTMNSFPLFKVNPQQTAAEKQAVLTSISNAIKNLGTTGSSSESPFAVAAMRGLDFFKDGDRGFIFIITDENDAHSIAKLSQPLSSYEESADTGQMESYTYTVYHSTVSVAKYTATGECRGPQYGQDGTITGYQTYSMALTYPTAQACQLTVTSMSSTCTLSCSFSTATEERTTATNCSGSQMAPGETLLSCSSSQQTLQAPKIIKGQSSQSFAFGLTSLQISQATGGAKNLFVNEFKSKVLGKLKEKYLISVVANISNQACTLKTGQSTDTFFTSIRALLPAQNMIINSICDSGSAFADGLAKVAANFERIVASKYLIGLAVGETVESAKIKLPGKTEWLDLISGIDFKVENDQFILLNSSLDQFEQIQLKISDSLNRGI